MFGGELVGGFLDEVGDLAALGSQVPEHRAIDVRAEGQAMGGAGQPGPGPGGLVGMAVVLHVGEMLS